ncbi:hypothetical protein Poli38472_011264 [Pythium oligandrum]|uniref:histone acetyltransferase n=1 Tax=Pythium oligandrum TaxID=41045 RepID=A0A8K1CQA1_PYTOL|nr:hypothetical protein Poli38472_011264 [Pythium oligandrum]|eukprot:TMW67644.1 hypothetical protein Poli38472_011264 [Pythium oligandrum]
MDVDMDARASFGAMASPAADGRARGRSDSEQKFLVYNDALLHAATCKEPKCTANEGRCHKVKVGIDHFVRCYGPRRRISPIESCPNCAQIWSLLCFHAKSCTQPLGGHCIVAQCDYLREKIARKQQQDQTELSRAQSILQSNPQRRRTEDLGGRKRADDDGDASAFYGSSVCTKEVDLGFSMAWFASSSPAKMDEDVEGGSRLRIVDPLIDDEATCGRLLTSFENMEDRAFQGSLMAASYDVGDFVDGLYGGRTWGSREARTPDPFIMFGCVLKVGCGEFEKVLIEEVSGEHQGASMGVDSNSQQKLFVYNDALLHATTCKEPKCTAKEGRCHKVKLQTDHLYRCFVPRRQYSSVDSCPSCAQIWNLLCFHAENCAQPSGGRCIVAYCDFLREKIARKLRQGHVPQSNPALARARSEPTAVMWPMKCRVAQLEADRQEVLAMLEQLRAEKAQRHAMVA